jgi:uncharacterized protein (TIGR00369 family)
MDEHNGFEWLEPGTGFGGGFGPIGVHWFEARIAFRVSEQHVNPRGVCHGGALSTFADYQIVPLMGRHVSLMDNPPTISLAVDYMGPAAQGAWVEGQAIRLKETRTLIFTQILLTADGEPVARSNAIYRKRSGAKQAGP